MTETAPLHIVTPLIKFTKAAKKLHIISVHLKLDNLQPGSSFKIRGIGHSLQNAISSNRKISIVVSSSGGNAGLASTIAARALRLDVVVFVPTTTPESTIAVLKDHGATVNVEGDVWDQTHESATRFLESLASGSGVYMHPFEGEMTWKGHSTLILEIKEQLNTLPHVIMCSVGGGGLLCGILTGLIDLNLPVDKRPIVICVETIGADSFSKAVAKGSLVSLDQITSIAKSLGAKTVSEGTLRLRTIYGTSLVRPLVVSDSVALDGVELFANEFRMLVEPACGACIGALRPDLLLSVVPELTVDSTVVVEVCGGFGVDLKMIRKWREQCL